MHKDTNSDQSFLFACYTFANEIMFSELCQIIVILELVEKQYVQKQMKNLLYSINQNEQYQLPEKCLAVFKRIVPILNMSQMCKVVPKIKHVRVIPQQRFIYGV